MFLRQKLFLFRHFLLSACLIPILTYAVDPGNNHVFLEGGLAARLYENLKQKLIVTTGKVSHTDAKQTFLSPPPATVTSRVNASSDDAEENISSGSVDLTSTDLELTTDGSTVQIIGMRFNGLGIPAGAIITSAYVEFETDVAWSSACNLTIKGQAADNPGTFTTTAYDISSRPKTNATVAWTPTAWNTVDEKHQTPDLTPVIQEIVNRFGWASGNSMVVFIEGTGTREAESYNGEAAAAPLLVVNYTTDGTLTGAPGGVTGSQLWLKANQGVNTGTNLIWADQSGSGRYGLQSTAANMPVLVNNGINFNPSLLFDGTNDHLTIQNLAGLPTGAAQVEVFAVANQLDLASQWSHIVAYGTGATSQMFALSKQQYSGNAAATTWGNDAISSSGEFDNGKPVLLDGKYTGTQVVFSSYGRQRATQTSTNNKNIAGGSIGAYPNATSGTYWNGNITEIILFPTNLTTAQVNRVNSYLALKYGITLDQTTPQNYTASDGTTIFWNATTNSGHKNNIAGIARDDSSALNQKQSRSVNAGLQVAIGLGNTIAGTNAGNPNDFTADYSALVWGDNGSSALAWTATGAPAGRQVLSRTWKVQETGSVGSVQVQVPDNSGTNGLPDEGSNPVYLLVDADGNFASGATVIPMTLNGTNWEANVDFTNGQFFTFAQGCVFSLAGTQINVTPCAGGANGAINLTASGGVAPYTYNWSDIGTVGNLQNRTGLVAGDYTVSVTDAASCLTVASFTITEPDPITLFGTVTPASGSPSGAIDLTVVDGVAPYAYAWAASGGGVVPAGQANSQDLTGLVGGTYKVTVTDAGSCTKTATYVVQSSVYKQLYLSDPSQALDRMDPVASADGTTAQTVTISNVSSSTVTLNPIADTYLNREAFTTNFGTNTTFSIEGEEKKLKRALLKFDLSSIPVGAAITSATLTLQKVGGDIISYNVGIYRMENTTPAKNWTENGAHNVKYDGTTQWTALGGEGDHNTSEYASTNVSSNGSYSWTVTSLIDDWVNNGVPNNGLMIKALPEQAGNQPLFDFNSREAASGKPVLTINYATAGGTNTTFTQSPALCSPLTIKAGQPITITNYITIVSGSMPANPNITATLKYGSNIIISLFNPTYNSGTGLLTWTGTLGSDRTVPAGQALVLDVSTSQSGVTFAIQYDSQTKPSKINLPVSTYIDIASYDVYNTAYPGGSIITNAVGGQVVYPRAVVTDPFGFSDITGLNINISPPLPGTTVAATSVATAGCTRTYQYTWTTPFSSGTMNIPATAKEGLENTVTDVQPLSFDLCTPTIGTPVFASGASSTRCQGAGSVTYSATSTSSTGISYSLDAASLAAGNTISSVTGAVTYVAGWGGTSTITAMATGCGGPKTATHTATVAPNVGTPVFVLGESSVRCQGAGTVTYTATASNSTGITYSLDAASLSAGNSINASTGAVTFTAGWTGTSTITASAAGCGGPKTATHTVTQTPSVTTPVFALGATSTRCQGGNSVTYSASASNTTGIAYSLDAASVAAGNIINASTGVVTYVAGWSGTSTITASAAGCGGPKTASHTVTITPNGTLTFALGATSTRPYGAGMITYTATANNGGAVTYSLDATSLAAGNTINSSTGQVTYSAGWVGTSVITASVNGCNGTQTATHTANTNNVYKQLYLSDPSQALDRVDPVATADATTATSQTIGEINTIQPSNGVAIWHQNGVQTPQYKVFSGNTNSFGSEATAPTVGNNLSSVLMTAQSPVNQSEAFLLEITDGKQIYLHKWNGSGWTAGSFNPVDASPVKNVSVRSAAIAYSSDGSAMLVWDNNVADNLVHYRTWSGTSWSAAQNFTIETGANNKAVNHMRLAAHPSSNEMILVFTDDGDGDDYAYVWNGSSWGNGLELTIDGSNTPHDANVIYERISGHALVVFGKADDNAIYYRTWDGSSWSAEQVKSYPTGAATAAKLGPTSLAASPNSDVILMGLTTEAKEGIFMTWDGSSFSTAAQDNRIVTALDKAKNISPIDIAFESQSGQALGVVQSTGGQFVTYFTWAPGSGYSAAATTADFGKKPRIVQLSSDKHSDKIMLSVNAEKLGKTLLWNGSSWGAIMDHETDMGLNGDEGAGNGIPISYFWLPVGNIVFTPTTSFTMAPALCSDLTIKGNQTITVTTYLSMVSGSLTNGQTYNINAVLRYGGTNIAILNPATYSSANGGILTWTGSLPSDVTVPAGQAITLDVRVANNMPGVSFALLYDSQTKPSKINLPVSTFIDITSHAVYSAAYPGGSIITSVAAGTTVYPRTVVSDPFGFSDITGLTMNISPTVGNVTATSVATAGCTRTYQYTWNTTGLGGTYSLPATAKEGYENAVTDVQALNFDICSPAIGTPVFALGTTSSRCQGAGTVTYSATSTNSTGMTYSLDAASAAAGNTINASTGAVTFTASWNNPTVITATATGCGGPKSSTHTVNFTSTVGTPVFALGSISSRCQGAATVTYAATANNSSGITYSLDGASLAGGNTINASTGAVTFVAGWVGTSTVTANAAGCSGPKTSTHTITIDPSVGTPVFDLGASSTRCGGGVFVYTASASNATGITYSLDAASLAAGNAINSSTGAVTFTNSWTGNSTITATANGCNGPSSATHTVSISPACPPIALDDAANGQGGSPLIINVLANDTDVNNDINPSSISILTQPENGDAVISGGQVVYLPNGTFEGVDQFTYRVCDFTAPTTLCDTATVLVTIDPTIVDACSEAVKPQVYYMPYPEGDARLALIASSGSPWLPIPSNNIRTIISIKVPYPGMTLLWDHWEDGYEADPSNPLQATTQVWGDGNPYNGVAPGYADDVLPAGAAIVMDNTMPAYPRNPANIFFDGKDKLISSGAITVTQVSGEPSIIFVQCMKTNVTPTINFGKSFTIPVGEDFNSQDFRYTALFIRASEDSTVVSIDKNNNGSFETIITLNEGESYLVDGGVLTGAVVTGSAPIGVDLHFGGVDGYSSREVPVFPATWYSDTYYTPVPTTQSPDSAVVMLYNSLNRAIDINWFFGLSTPGGTINLPPKSVKRFPLGIDSNKAYKFVNPTGESFTAIEIVDSYTPGGGGNSGSTYDWAFNLISEERLTSFAAIAWAPGSVNGTANGNPVWVTPTANTTIYVKYDGDLLNGGSQSPCGLRYDVSYTLNELRYKKLLDSDKDQSGLAVYTCDGTKIAAAYGEDPSLSGPANPYWDVGSTIQPFCGQKLIFASNDRAYTVTDHPVTIPVLKNDKGFLAEIDQPTLSILGYLPPKNGTVSVNSNGTLLYTPNPGFMGMDTLEYGICSTPGSPPQVVCDRAYVYIVVNSCPAPSQRNLILGQVFSDKNKDGIKNDDGSGFPGAKVYLYVDGNCNGAINPGELADSVIVDSSGSYQFIMYPEKLLSDNFDGPAGTSTCASGNDGTVSWASNWVDAGDPSTGFCVSPAQSEGNTDVEIMQDGAFGYALRLDDLNRSATRTANLSGATYAFLSFSYRKANNNLTSGENIFVQVSTNGSSFTTIFTISGNGTTDAGYVPIYNLNISSFAAATTSIRFLTNSSVDEGDFVFIDDVTIRYLKYPQCYITRIDPATIPADYYLTTAGQHVMTATNSGTCLAPYDFGIAKNSTTISGTLYNDANGLSDGQVNGLAFGNPSGATVYAYLVDASGKVRFKTTVNSANGTYSFPQADVNSTFTLMVSTTDVPLYADAPSSANLPAGWASAGEAYGTNNGAGTGNETGTPNSAIAVTTGTLAVTGVNIGIQQVNAGPDRFACRSGSVTMAATTTPGTWTAQAGNPGTATITSPNSPITTITNFTATGTYYFLWTNNGVTDFATVTVVADASITAQATGFTECVGGSLPVSVTATGGVPPLSYQWQKSTDNVNFTNIGGANLPEYTPPSTTPGTTYYRAIITPNGGGCGTLTSAVAPVSIVNDPAIVVPPVNISECIGEQQALTVTVSGGTSPLNYQWQSSSDNVTFSDIPGADSSSYIPQDVTPGTTYYRVIVSAGGNGCGGETSGSVSVTVNSVPFVDLGADTTICPGTNATLTASTESGAPPYSFTWNNGLGSGQVKTVSPSGETTYEVTVTDSKGCTATDDIQVSIGTCTEVCDNGIDDDGDGLTDCADPDCGGTITASVTADDSSLCEGQAATLTASASGGAGPFTYTWSNGLGNGEIKVVTPVSTTIYTVTVSSPSGCTGTAQVTIVVNPQPVVDAGSDITVCSGTNINLLANATGGDEPYSYVWSHGLGAGSSHSVTPMATTTYQVTVTTANGCTATGEVTVSVNETPVANAGTDVTICKNFSTTLSASVTGGKPPYQYAWNNGLGTGSSKTVTPLVTTTYTVTITSDNGCYSTDQVTVTVQNCPEICGNGIDDDGDGQADCADSDCGPTVTLGSDISICTNHSATLVATVTGGNGGLTYTWSNGLGSGQSKTVTPLATTTYTVTVTSQSGCSAVDQITVTVLPCPEDCTNGIDDDNDGLIDCDDPDCAGVTAPVLMDDEFTACPGMVFTDRVIYNDQNLQSPAYSILAQPQTGTVTIDGTGKFIFTPGSTQCTTDYFIYQVCNQTSGCCASATVTVTFGGTSLPVLTNVPADITIGCDDAVPPPTPVLAIAQCPGVYVNFDEASNYNNIGNCQAYSITRTWTATDVCGNTASAQQVITLVDQTRPELFQLYTMANGKRLVAGVSQRVTHDWKYVKFPVAFGQPPVVLTQVVSNNEASAVVVKQRNISTQGFEMRLREEEMADDKHVGESVAWVAIEPGGQGSGLTYEAGTLADVTHVLKTLNFTQVHNLAPRFFSSVQTTKQLDPATIRHIGLNTGSVQMYLQEETSKDGETTHLAERVGYLAVEPGKLMQDKAGKAFGETGSLSLTNAWATVTLTRRYNKPVVIVGGLTQNETDPVTVRVRNVTDQSFEVSLKEWNYLNGSHTPEAVSWMVIEGSLPGNDNYYCAGETETLIPGVNVFAVDNCDDVPAFGHESFQSFTSNGLLTTHSWMAIDDCGNVNVVTLYDTCAMAAVKVKAELYGPLTGSTQGLMRDDLRSKGFVPLFEPYSGLPAFPHVNNNVNYVTICHDPGTPGQMTMTIPEADLQSHLDHGDELGVCDFNNYSATIPAAAQAANFRTIASGIWTDPSIWAGGAAPPVSSIANKTISIEHNVVHPNGNLDLKAGAKVWATNGKLRMNNGNIKMQSGANIILSNASLELVNGSLEMTTGSNRFEIKDSDVSVSGDFKNLSGTLVMDRVCLNVSKQFTNYQAGVDSIRNVTLTAGTKFANQAGAKMYAKNCNIRVTNGNIENESGSLVTGDSLVLWVENGNVTNNGTWTAPITQYCISGTVVNMGSVFPILENCGSIPGHFAITSCLLGANDGSQNANGITPEQIAGSGTISPDMLTTTGPKAVVDWLLVELRDAANSKNILSYATAVMLRDGSIVSEDGDSILIFPGVLEGDYYVAVRHRNHLGMMTDSTVYLTSVNPPLVDFTNLSVPVRGGVVSGRTFNGKRTMWAGDFNGDGKIIYQGPYNDVFNLFTRVLAEPANTQNLANFIIEGYELQDLNLDGRVIYQGPGNDRATLLYHTILSHPSNGSMLANFIVSEKLP